MEGSLVAYKVFSNGSVLNASEINDNLMNQSVMVFSNSAARSAAITSPLEGMLTYLEDTDTYESYISSSWVSAIPMGAWTAFTPTWGALTIGNGVYNTSQYQISGKTATVAIDFQLGSTSAVTGNLGITFPSELARANVYGTGLAQVLLVDASATTYFGFGLPNTTSAVNWSIRAGSGSPLALSSTSATAPFTWTTGDRIVFGATYEVA
jgi:hypothetical protein